MNDQDTKPTKPLVPYVRDVETGRIQIGEPMRRRLSRALGREVRIDTEADLATALVDLLEVAVYQRIGEIVTGANK